MKRRLAGRAVGKGAGGGFFDGRSDGGSVRRYRVEVEDDE